jgi:hypothetical protein
MRCTGFRRGFVPCPIVEFYEGWAAVTTHAISLFAAGRRAAELGWKHSLSNEIARHLKSRLGVCHLAQAQYIEAIYPRAF